jgi:hypothetical protein
VIARLFLALLLAADALVLLPSTPLHPGCAWAAGSSHAALVVEHGDGRVLDYCVGFDGASVTGEQLLQLAHTEFGLEYGVESYGAGLGDAVCQIDYEPATYPPNCLQAGSPYWNMFVSRAGGAWTGSNRGASTQTFADGDAEGWHWTSGGTGPPPSPAGVCSTAPPATAPPPAAPPQPAANPGAAPAPEPAAQATAPTSEPATPGPTASAAVSPTASAARVTTRPRAPAGTASLALATAAAAGGAMIGLALLRLLAPRLGR